MSIPEIDLPVYEAMARKDLSFGCYVQKNHWSNSNEPLVGRITSDPSGFCTGDQMGFNAEYMGTYSTTIFGTYVLNQKDDDGNKKWKVIGHEILLSDVLNWIVTNMKSYDECPHCGKQMQYEGGQESSHPEAYTWDVKPSCYCKDCDYLTYEMEDKKGAALCELTLLQDNFSWDYSKPYYSQQSETTKSYIRSLI